MGGFRREEPPSTFSSDPDRSATAATAVEGPEDRRSARCKGARSWPQEKRLSWQSSACPSCSSRQTSLGLRLGGSLGWPLRPSVVSIGPSSLRSARGATDADGDGARGPGAASRGGWRRGAHSKQGGTPLDAAVVRLRSSQFRVSGFGADRSPSHDRSPRSRSFRGCFACPGYWCAFPRESRGSFLPPIGTFRAQPGRGSRTGTSGAPHILTHERLARGFDVAAADGEAVLARAGVVTCGARGFAST